MNAINYGTPAKLGMLLPSGNQAAEPQFHAMLPADVSLHTTRLKLTGTPEELGRFIRSETAQYGKIIRDLGLKIE